MSVRPVRASGAGVKTVLRTGIMVVSDRAQLNLEQMTVPRYAVNERAVARARALIEARQYVRDSNWGEAQPRAADQDAFLETHS